MQILNLQNYGTLLFIIRVHWGTYILSEPGADRSQEMVANHQ